MSLLAFPLLFASSGSFAQSSDPCKTLASTLDDNMCAKQKFDIQDHQLNNLYQALLKQLSSSGENAGATKKLLIAAQRKWVEFRDADCTAQSALYKGGSVAPQIDEGCMTAHTEQRIKELQLGNWQAG